MAHLIECPHCASRFVTIFNPGKVERCPYCARTLVHGSAGVHATDLRAGAALQGTATQRPAVPRPVRPAPTSAPGPPDRPPGHQALGP